MVQLEDIHPLTGFLRNHKTHMDRLAATGRPEVLTVNGEARVIVQDAAAYQKMINEIDSMRAEQIVRERLASLDRGDAGVPADQVLADVRKRLGGKKKG